MKRVLWFLLLALLMIAPVPFGAFRPLAWSIIGLGIALLSLGWLAGLATGRIALFWRGWLWPPAIIFLFLLAWIAAQSWLPAAPATAHPIWEIAGNTLGHVLSPRIGADPEAASVALLRLLTSAMIFWLTLQLGRNGSRAVMLVSCLALAGGAQALYGLVNWIAGNHYLLWFPRTAYFGDVTGTFVNRNTFATFAGICLLACMVLVSDGLRRGMRIADPSLSWLGRRIEALSGWPIIFLAAAVLLVMAVIQSHSRMGIASTIAGMAVLLALLRATRQVRGWTPLVIALAGFIAMFVLIGTGATQRIADGAGDRGALNAVNLDVVQSAPLLGSGYNSFSSIFPMYRDNTLALPVNYTMAHNSYMELAIDLGVPAAILAVLALAWLVGLALIGLFRRDRDRAVPTLAVSASMLIGVHALADFSVQIPAVQYWFAALLGVGVAQAFPSGEPTVSIPSDDAVSDL